MKNEVLESIGLTKGESKVYISLLKLGQVSVGPIINSSGVSRSKIYDVLDRLKRKGLVSEVRDGQRKKFNATPPSRIKEFLEKEKEEIESKEDNLEKILPKLKSILPKEDNTRAEIFHGPRGIKAFFDLSLYNNKEEILVLGYSKEASLYFHSYFRAYHKERIKRKISAKVIYDYETWSLKKRGKRKYVEQRYLKKGVKTPAFIYIFGDVVGTIVFTKEQKLCFMIKNKTAAESYKQYFDLLWKESVKTRK